MRRIAAVAIAFTVIAAGSARASVVHVFPIPGSRVAAPRAQIVFRGVSARALGRVSVTGSRTGRHIGLIAGDSDRYGASFLPAKPFAPGEVVTVRTRHSVLGGQGGMFRFTVARPAGAITAMNVGSSPRRPGDVLAFHSRPDLTPVRIDVLHNTSADASGDIFIGPQVGPLRNGPMIVDPAGHLVWFSPVAPGSEANNVSVQRYRGRPVLTWWQGYLDLRLGVGTGRDLIMSSSYRRIATVSAADGLTADLHEFEITPAGTALITAYLPVFWDARSVKGSAHTRVLDAIVQEIDIKTGLLLFEWDSLDHVALSDSEIGLPRPGGVFDYFHINSVHADGDGTLIVSARNAWAAYKISRQDGQVIWTLGGRKSSFAMAPGASFAFQHDVRIGAGDASVTVFDDGAGPPSVHAQSRAIQIRLNTTLHTATLASDFTHSPALLAHYEGDVEPLPDGDDFVGWGEQPFFTEFSPAGAIVFDARFADRNTTYRAVRAPWSGTPHTAPSVAASARGRTATVYASWNGATGYTAWRVLAGPRPASLRAAGTFARAGFETRMAVVRSSYVEVQALGGAGRVLGTSFIVRVR